MQYILIFGVVFVIMQAVILLFFFMISSAAEDVAGQIRKTFLKEMEVFDELYEEKAAKLKKVQEEYERFIKPNSYLTLVGKCEVNRWMDNVSPQILIEDFELKQEWRF